MLENKIALVTGASRGIGREIAKKLADCGAFVFVNYCGSKEKAEETIEQITALGGKAEAIRADVAEEDSVAKMFSEILEKQKRLDILVNNAGITKDNLILKMKEEEFDAVIHTNLYGVYHCLKYAAKQMLKQRSGRIVNISSISGVIGNAGQVNYCAAKAGVIGMTKSLARELGSRGITVNAVAPGLIRTEMTEGLSDQIKEGFLEKIPLKRFGQAEEVAAAVAFLVSEEAAYITGQTIQVDGGMGM